jgi:hypothetical protein
VFGVHKETFERMLTIVTNAYEEMRKKGGRRRKLSVLDMLIIMLGYYHDYRTMENIAFDYDVHKQRICEAIAFVEQVLIKDGVFSLPSKRKLLDEKNVATVIVDVAECETERPKKTKIKLFRQEKTAYNQRPNRHKWQYRRDYLRSRSQRCNSRFSTF